MAIKSTNTKVLAANKKAYHDYFVEDTLECGIVLLGNEVKSAKSGKISIKESWVSTDNNELTLKGCHISRFDKANAFDVRDERCDRRLLAHKGQIIKLSEKVKMQGYTIVPLQVYLSKGLVKVSIGLCKGKHNYDKRDALKKKQMQRDIDRRE